MTLKFDINNPQLLQFQNYYYHQRQLQLQLQLRQQLEQQHHPRQQQQQYRTFTQTMTEVPQFNFTSFADSLLTSEVLGEEFYKQIDSNISNTSTTEYQSQPLKYQRLQQHMDQQLLQIQHQLKQPHQNVDTDFEEQFISLEEGLTLATAADRLDSPVSPSSSSSLFDINGYPSTISSEFLASGTFGSVIPSWEDFQNTLSDISETKNTKNSWQSSLSSISSSLPSSTAASTTQLHLLHATNTADNNVFFNNFYSSYDNVKTINTIELTKPITVKRSPVLKSQASQTEELLLNQGILSPMASLSGQPSSNSNKETSNFQPIHPSPPLTSSTATSSSSIEFFDNLSFLPKTEGSAAPIPSSSIVDQSVLALLPSTTSNTTRSESPAMDSPESGTDYDDKKSRKRDKKSTSKKISDSRLSLVQLSFVLDLPNDLQETAKREKKILNLLKNDLGFPLGEKTWIRDTPSDEREALVEKLWKLSQETYQYGYSKETLSVVIRRASYYLMQGRLRRERRLEKKKTVESLARRKSQP